MNGTFERCGSRAAQTTMPAYGPHQAQGETPLGGRLPLAHRTALTGAKLKLFDRFVAEAVPWARREGFVMQSAGGALIGPFNPLLESPEISESFWDWQHAEGQHTTLSDREREVVILAVGAVWRSSYELLSHSAAARIAGLSRERVEALAGNRMPDQLSTREQLRVAVCRVNSRLSAASSNRSTTKPQSCSEPTGSATCSI